MLLLKRKMVSGITLTLLLVGMFTVAFKIQTVRASGTVYIRSDGSIDPPTAPIQRNGDVYLLTDNIAISGDCIVIERSNIVLDGTGFLIQGNLSGRGVSSTGISNVTIKNMTIQRFEYDIYFESSSSDTVSGNSLTKDCFYGISFISSSGNTISGNNVTNSRYWAIGLFSSSNNTVSGNNESANGYGVQLTESFDNTVSGNDITDSYYGIEIGDAYNNTIRDYNSTNSLRGIFLESDFSGNSSGNILRRNAFAGNTFNFGVKAIPDFFNDVDMSNTVDGKPICYWINVHDVSVPLDAGYVALINSTRVVVSDLNLAKNEQGVLLAYATYITITQNNVTDNRNGISIYSSSFITVSGNTVTRNGVYWGIGLFSSSNNNVVGNNVTKNYYDGVVLESSPNNTVAGNSITANSGGISFGSSDDNTVSGNDLKSNGLYLSSSSSNIFTGNNITATDGIWLESGAFDNTFRGNIIANNSVGVTLYSSNNQFYHNDFIHNSFQVNNSYPGFANFWDDGYPSGGNYWSDYNGTDFYSGPYQNETGADGIGDVPYVIDGNNQDRFPLVSTAVSLRGDVNYDGVVDIYDAIILAGAFNSVPGSPDWNPNADINKDNAVDIYDAIILASNFGKSWSTLYTNWYDGLVGYWKFDEGTGNMTLDSSGNGNNGTLINGPAWVDGKYGKALNFSGTNYVSVPHSSSLELQDFSSEAWIYMTKRPYQQGYYCFIIRHWESDGEDAGMGYQLEFDSATSTNDNLCLWVGTGLTGGVCPVQYNSINDLTLNEWHQTVATFDGNTAVLYIDGLAKASNTWTQHLTLPPSSSSGLLMGLYASDSTIDNVMVYNRSLSAEEVMNHYVLPPP